MMAGELNDLYQDIILDHSKNPRNSGYLEGATHSARENNPLCGDRVSGVGFDDGRDDERKIGSGSTTFV